MADYLTTVWGKSLRLDEVERLQVNGFEAATATARIQVRRGPMDLRLAAIRHETTIHRFLFLIPPQLTQPLSDELRRTIQSFRRLSPGEAPASPQRLRLHVVQPGESRAHLIQLMARETGVDRRFDIINGLTDGASPPAGSPVKVIAE